MNNKGINLVNYELTPIQAKFIEWCKEHPHARIRELKIYEGVPLEAEVYTKDGIGTDTVRFDKLLKSANLNGRVK